MASGGGAAMDLSPELSPDAMDDDMELFRPPPTLAGRSIQQVSDLTLQEQLYLYERTRLLKAKSSGDQNRLAKESELCPVEDADVDERVGGQDNSVYLIFMEGSTRTRESLRNAAVFHGVKVNEFQAESSSFQKNETITDTMKMLTVYSTMRSVFVVRSALEGVCSWLQTVMGGHALKFGIPIPSFLNAGDGRNSHPLSELADMFSLLEARQWNRESIHIALVGDLAHGRTAHSKVEGLPCFKKVRVDLIAPENFAYPVEYRTRMTKLGFEVRTFKSIEEYLTRETPSTLAPLWYFFQPQFGRLGDVSQEMKADLRDKIAFRMDWRHKLAEGTRFFQTLPRDKEHPIIPLCLDDSTLNGWDAVSANSYFLHVTILSALFGKIGRSMDCAVAAESMAKPNEDSWMRLSSGHGFSLLYSSKLADEVSKAGIQPSGLPGFVHFVDIYSKAHTRTPDRAAEGGSIPLTDGLVVDHIGVSTDASHCWKKVRMLRSLLGWTKYVGSEGVYSSHTRGVGVKKGLLSLPNFDLNSVTIKEMKMMASIAPGCTVNAIVNSKVVGKFRLTVPERIYNLPSIGCKNTLCIANPSNKQRDVVSFFERVPFYETSALPNCKAAEFLFVCKYCRWPHEYGDIWI